MVKGPFSWRAPTRSAAVSKSTNVPANFRRRHMAATASSAGQRVYKTPVTWTNWRGMSTAVMVASLIMGIRSCNGGHVQHTDDLVLRESWRAQTREPRGRSRHPPNENSIRSWSLATKAASTAAKARPWGQRECSCLLLRGFQSPAKRPKWDQGFQGSVRSLLTTIGGGPGRWPSCSASSGQDGESGRELHLLASYFVCLFIYFRLKRYIWIFRTNQNIVIFCPLAFNAGNDRWSIKLFLIQSINRVVIQRRRCRCHAMSRQLCDPPIVMGTYMKCESYSSSPALQALGTNQSQVPEHHRHTTFYLFGSVSDDILPGTTTSAVIEPRLYSY
jgi:hypothetical protein